MHSLSEKRPKGEAERGTKVSPEARPELRIQVRKVAATRLRRGGAPLGQSPSEVPRKSRRTAEALKGRQKKEKK